MTHDSISRQFLMSIGFQIVFEIHRDIFCSMRQSMIDFTIRLLIFIYYIYFYYNYNLLFLRISILYIIYKLYIIISSNILYYIFFAIGYISIIENGS